MLKTLLVLLLISSAYAEDTSFDHKSGFLFGLGPTLTTYHFPSRFSGQSKKRIDTSQTLIGPVFNVGYDQMFFGKFLIGVRGEGWYADSLKMGNTENSQISEQQTGKASALSVAGRFGIPFRLTFTDPVGLLKKSVLELFLEVGAGKYWASMKKSFTYKSSPHETYTDNIRDQRLSAITAAGINFASYTGAFFELKFLQTRTLSNTLERHGTESVNGGAETALPSVSNKNVNQNVITNLMMTFGYHW